MIALTRREDRPLVIGVVHLLPLPGAPTASPGLAEVEDRALADAQALLEGGVDGLILENFGDAPFAATRVDAFTVAAMTRIAGHLREIASEGILGINVLRNDALSALAIATAVHADFVRINVHTGAMVTDQGLVSGDARATLLERNRLGAQVAIAADLLVKHAAPLAPTSIEQAAHDTWTRGGADALIVTGSATGSLFDPLDLDRVRHAAPAAPLWIGSGLTPDTAQTFGPQLDGAIVGTWFHARSQIALPIDVDRVRQLMQALTA